MPERESEPPPAGAFYAYATFVMVACVASSYLLDMCGPDKPLCKGVYATGLAGLLYVVVDTMLDATYYASQSREDWRRLIIQLVLLAVIVALLSHKTLRQS